MSEFETFDNFGDGQQVPVARRIPPAIPTGLPTAHPMLLADTRRHSATADLAIFMAMVVIVLFSLQGAAAMAERAGLVTDERMLSITATLCAAGMLLITTFAILKRRGQSAASIGFCVDSWWRTILLGVVAMVGAYAVMILTVIIMSAISPAAYYELSQNQERITGMFPKFHPALLMVLALTVGFYEEVLCRGFLLTRLRKSTNSLILAVVISSALFAAPHAASQSPITVIPLFFVGILWAIMSVRQKSVVPVIIGHGLFDLCQLVALHQLHPGWE